MNVAINEHVVVHHVFVRKKSKFQSKKKSLPELDICKTNLKAKAVPSNDPDIQIQKATSLNSHYRSHLLFGSEALVAT